MMRKTLRMLYEQAQKQTLLLVEDRAEYIIANQGEKLVARAKADTRKKMEAKDVVEKLKEADPTSNKQFLQWIVNRYLASEFKMEDVSRLADDLTEFKRVLPKLDKKDINAYATLTELYDALEKFKGTEVKSKGENERETKLEGAEKVIDTPNFKVIKILTKEAAMYYGKGTKWCTAAEKHNMFDEYNGQGPLYVLLAGTGDKIKKYQMHVESNQFMDERDNEVSASDIKLLSSFPAYTDFLNMMIKQHYKFED